jgi:hypothetical protein
MAALVTESSSTAAGALRAAAELLLDLLLLVAVALGLAVAVGVGDLVVVSVVSVLSPMLILQVSIVGLMLLLSLMMHLRLHLLSRHLYLLLLEPSLLLRLRLLRSLHRRSHGTRNWRPSGGDHTIILLVLLCLSAEMCIQLWILDVPVELDYGVIDQGSQPQDHDLRLLDAECDGVRMRESLERW